MTTQAYTDVFDSLDHDGERQLTHLSESDANVRMGFIASDGSVFTLGKLMSGTRTLIAEHPCKDVRTKTDKTWGTILEQSLCPVLAQEHKEPPAQHEFFEVSLPSGTKMNYHYLPSSIRGRLDSKVAGSHAARLGLSYAPSSVRIATVGKDTSKKLEGVKMTWTLIYTSAADSSDEEFVIIAPEGDSD
ncbi:hypothetical protein IAU60_000411 [Kwoniella sp. DSM 27419]